MTVELDDKIPVYVTGASMLSVREQEPEKEEFFAVLWEFGEEERLVMLGVN